MFLSLRLAALTSVLFISHVFGLAIPPQLVKRFVLFFFFSMRWQTQTCIRILKKGTNFATVMHPSVIGNTETSPSLELMIHLLPAETLLRVRNFCSLSSPVGKFIFFSLSHNMCNYSRQDAGGGCKCSANDGCEVVASTGPHVRSKHSFFFVHGFLIYILDRNRKDLHLCHTSQFFKETHSCR